MMKAFVSVLLLLIAAPTSVADDSTSNPTSSAKAYGSNLFAETQYTEYDPYATAWRYLGWYVKCGAPSSRYNQEGSHSHSGSNDNAAWQGNNYCQRFLIWASYIDENYEGGGIGEYSYYDPYSNYWDESACDVHGNGRCAPMDCHLTNTTTWTLMGVYKEASYFGNDAFFEQLFKHEGICVWNDEDVYDFMSEARENYWTQGCVNTGWTGDAYYRSDDDINDDDNGNYYLYIDLKPTWNGNMTNALYTDSNCKTEYEGLDVDVETIAASMGLLYGDYLTEWNDGLEAWKVCRPCVAHSLANQYVSTSSYNDDDAWQQSDPNEGYFQCNDDADYTNVNQCMKFRTHANLEVATWEDLVTATNQGGILEVNVGGITFGSERMTAEQDEYERTMRKQSLQDERNRAMKEAQAIRALRPVAIAWKVLGASSVGVGALALAISVHQFKRRNPSKVLTLPLL